MTAIRYRNSALALVEETTEGTLPAPAASTDYAALQDDFTMSPVVAQIETPELQSSLGQAQTLLGAEDPTASGSHTLRHSGTEGDAPNWDMYLKASFGGSDDAGVEHDVVSATTTTTTVDTGEGATYLRGQALMIKDATNGYSIRCVDSVSGEVISNSFAVDTAPAATTLLGEALTYYPVNSGHPSYSVWWYMGNEGAIAALSGGRVTSATWTFTAGELINASYSWDAKEFFFNPIVIDATNDHIDFDDGGGEENVTVAQKAYKDPNQLAEAIQTAMNAATGDTITVTYEDIGADQGKFTFSSTGGTFSLLWNTGANTANTIASAIGFSSAADDTGSTSYTGDNAITLSSPQTPAFDDTDALVARHNEVLLGEVNDNVCINTNTCEIAMTQEIRKAADVCEETARGNSILTSRAVTITLTGELAQYDADRYTKFRKGDEVRFQYNFGTRDDAGNWEPGKCGAFYAPTCKIVEVSFENNDDVIDVSVVLQPFVKKGANSLSDEELYLSFV